MWGNYNSEIHWCNTSYNIYSFALLFDQANISKGLYKSRYFIRKEANYHDYYLQVQIEIVAIECIKSIADQNQDDGY